MIHIIPDKSYCIIYKKSHCKKYLADLICERVPTIPTNQSQRDHLSSNGHQNRVWHVHNIQEQFR